MFEQLVSLQQGGSVDEYIQEFERLTSQVKRLPDEQFAGYFIHGLKEGIRGRVRSMRALGLLTRSRLLNVARAVEYELQERWGSTPQSNGARNHFGSGSFHHFNSYYPSGPNAMGRNSNGEWGPAREGKETHDKGPSGARHEDRKGGAHRDRGCIISHTRSC